MSPRSPAPAGIASSCQGYTRQPWCIFVCRQPRTTRLAPQNLSAMVVRAWQWPWPAAGSSGPGHPGSLEWSGWHRSLSTRSLVQTRARLGARDGWRRHHAWSLVKRGTSMHSNQPHDCWCCAQVRSQHDHAGSSPRASRLLVLHPAAPHHF